MAMLSSVVVLALAVTSSWCQTTFPTTHKTHKPRPTVLYDDVITTLANKGNFNTLLSLLKLANLDSTLTSVNELTLFAPTDGAFARLPAGTLDSLKNDIPALASILKYHVVGESHRLRHAQDKVFTTLDNGNPVRINVYNLVHTVTAEGVNVTERDIHVKNGYLQVLDGVLQAPSGNIMDIIASRTDLSTLNSLLTSSGLDAVIRADQNITVFAPTNDAFAKLSADVNNFLQNNDQALKETLLFHVVARITLYSLGMKHSLIFPSADKHHDKIMTLEDSTGMIYVNRAKILDRDLSGTNGVVHTIDDVLVPVRVLVDLDDQGVSVG